MLGVAQLRGRPARLGALRAAARVLRRARGHQRFRAPARAWIPASEQTWVALAAIDVALHRPADRGRRHARRRVATRSTGCGRTWRSGIKRGVADVKKSAGAAEATERTERDLNFKRRADRDRGAFVLMVGALLLLHRAIGGALVAALVMLIAGFFFAAVSGNLVGMIGSSNNPISGLTLATLIIAALLMVWSA